MLKTLKKNQPFIWISTTLFVIVFAIGCGSGGDQSKEAESESAPAAAESMAPSATLDSLPPKDSSASSRPEGIKTVPTQQ